MTLAGMSRRDRAVLAAAGVLMLYGLAAFLFFGMGRRDAWTKAQKGYERAAARLAGERALVADRDAWRDRLEAIQLQMPTIAEDELAATRWKRVVEKIAAAHSFHILGYGATSDGREEDLGEVWELALDIQYRSSLARLVEFLYALDTSEEGLFDVRQIEIATKKPGELTGKFTLTCAYKKGSSK